MDAVSAQASGGMRRILQGVVQADADGLPGWRQPRNQARDQGDEETKGENPTVDGDYCVAEVATWRPGTIAEVWVVRDKSISAAKATENDLRVKYALILGADPNPPKDIEKQNTNPPKKKN